METPIRMTRAGALPAARPRPRAIAAETSLKKRARPVDSLVRVVLQACGVLSLFTTLGIVYVLAEQSLLFFASSAYVITKAPVAETMPNGALRAAATAGQDTLAVRYDAERSPYLPNTFIQVGGETMRVVERVDDRTIRVARGVEATAAAEHAAGAPIVPMREVQVRPAAPLAAADTLLIVPASAAYKFEPGMKIQVGIEVMRITGSDGGALTVERGVDGTIARAHSGEDAILSAEHPALLEFLTSATWAPQIGQFGVLPLLNATLLTSLVGLAVAIPLGLGSAIFLSEYAPPRLRGALKPILEILAGVPTVVYGFFALTFVTPALLQAAFGQQVQFYNMLSAGLVIGILITPLISSMSEDALSAVPRALREASYGLGATRLETTVKVVIPAAMSGLSAALIIATSRAVGETMIVAVAAGAGPNFTLNLFEGAETMTGHISRISGGDLSYNSIDYNSIFAIGLLLFVLTLGLNLVSGHIARRLREAY